MKTPYLDGSPLYMILDSMTMRFEAKKFPQKEHVLLTILKNGPFLYSMNKQTYTFQAETKELLNLMIHSLYSHREIFLRELISNASDAIEKLKFESLTQSDLISPNTEFEIRLETDADKKTLSITDNGIGMTQEEVIQNIGTIAHSGTKQFLKNQNSLKDHPELIGQFGVGFYSAFMVADRVTLHTQKVGATQGVIWESDGTGSYSLDHAQRPQGHGTTITLHLKDLSKKSEDTIEATSPEGLEDEHALQQNFTDPWTIKQIVKKYSDFVAYPIKMKVTETKTVDGKAEISVKDETLNTQKALWLRSPSEITQDEYKEFYRHISHDWMDPLKTVHYRAEGTLEFASIFYIPSQKPFDFHFREHKVGLSLYVKRVLIKSDCEDLIPHYLRFVKGMVDSDDLSLNVSREMLQQDRQIMRIKKALTGKMLGSLKELQDQDRASYEKFWEHFGSTLKEGIPTDSAHGDKIKELMLYHSTHTTTKTPSSIILPPGSSAENTDASNSMTTLQEYVSRMKPGQKSIYYITGDHLKVLENSPYLEKPRAKGFEVLLMSDKVDAWAASYLNSFADKPFQSVMAENLDLDTPEEKEAEKQKLQEFEEKFKPLISHMREGLKDKVKDIRLSDRLTESPVCLVASGEGSSAHMERLLESMGQNIPKSKRVLEINPRHPLFEKLLTASSSVQEEWADLLYQQALLNEGSQIEDPLRYSQKIAKIMMEALR